MQDTDVALLNDPPRSQSGALPSRSMASLVQPTLFSSPYDESEDPSFLSDQLITCIGNKRALLSPLVEAIDGVRTRLGKDKLRVLDAFAGSGVVSRLLKQYASTLTSNDMETYARIAAECYLTNRNEVDQHELKEAVQYLNSEVDRVSHVGFIRSLYAPHDEQNITTNDRVFYTPENARRLDTYRILIEGLPQKLKPLLMGPLLSKASIHANTAGVFKGFYKDRNTGAGRFGGTGRDALDRICRRIVLEPPVLSRFECERVVLQMDANRLAEEFRGFDLAYLDPPYNQHPYGSNYFMLNLLADYCEPTDYSLVSGIPTDWNRSDYNVRGKALASLTKLITDLDARFIAISYNDEGFIKPDAMRALLTSLGRVSEITTKYNTFRGSRNLRGREIHVTEHLFVLEKEARS